MPRRKPDITRVAHAFEALRADYSAAKQDRFRRRRSGVSSMGSGADYHYRNESDYLRMMENARDFDRNDMVVGQIVDRAVANMIQDGFHLDPQTGDPELDRDLAARWKDWSTDPDQCDLAGEYTFPEIERLVLRQSLVDGDHFCLPNRDTGALELIEAHRCRTPSNALKSKTRTIIHGVVVDGNRKRQQYWFTRDDIDPTRALIKIGDIKQYPARDADGYRQVYHVYTSRRTSQTRGVTAFAPIFDACGYFEDINFATLVAKQVVSCFAIFREREIGFSVPGTETQQGAQSTEQTADGWTKLMEELYPGMQIPGLPGEKLSMGSPNVPNPEFFPHMRFILTIIGVNLGLPLVMVLMDASETNFSGWKGAVDQAKLGFRNNQRRFIWRLHRPVYQWKIRNWMAGDPALRRAAERQGINLFAHRWQPPGWGLHIQPMQEYGAQLLRRRNALISPRRWANEEGMDWEDLTAEIVEDNALLIARAFERAQELNAKYPRLNVTWREVASLPTPDGVKIALATGAGTEEEPAR